MTESLPVVLELSPGLGGGGAERALIDRIQPGRPWSDAFQSALWLTRPNELRLIGEAPSGSIQGACNPLNPFGVMRLLRKVRRLNPALTIVHSATDAILVLSLSALRLWRSPVVVIVHNQYTRGFYAALLRCVNRYAQMHIAVSAMAAKGDQVRGVDVVATHVLGTWAPTIDVNRSVSESLRLLFVGRLVESKNPVLMAEAVCIVNSQVGFRAVTLTIAGTGPLEEVIRGVIDNNDKFDAINFVGFVNNVPELLVQHDVLTLPSSGAEGLPLVVMEALVLGTAVLVTERTGVDALSIPRESIRILDSLALKTELVSEVFSMLASRQAIADDSDLLKQDFQWLRGESRDAVLVATLKHLIV